MVVVAGLTAEAVEVEGVLPPIRGEIVRGVVAPAAGAIEARPVVDELVPVRAGDVVPARPKLGEVRELAGVALTPAAEGGLDDEAAPTVTADADEADVVPPIREVVVATEGVPRTGGLARRDAGAGVDATVPLAADAEPPGLESNSADLKFDLKSEEEVVDAAPVPAMGGLRDALEGTTSEFRIAFEAAGVAGGAAFGVAGTATVAEEAVGTEAGADEFGAGAG